MIKIYQTDLNLHQRVLDAELQKYLRALRFSYNTFVARGGRPNRYSIGNHFFEIRDCSPEDISNIASMGGEDPFFNSFYFRRRSISDSDRPDYPVGFSLSRKTPENPRILEASYAYVDPNSRGQSLGIIQTIDILLRALEEENTELVLGHVIKGRSSFYESLNGLSSSEMAEEGRLYKISLEDKKKAKSVIDERLKNLGVVVIS